MTTINIKIALMKYKRNQVKDVEVLILGNIYDNFPLFKIVCSIKQHVDINLNENNSK